MEGVVCACDEDGVWLLDVSGVVCGVDCVWVCVLGEVVGSFGDCESLGD